MAIINVIACKSAPVFRYNHGEVLFNNKAIAPVVTFNKINQIKLQTQDLGDSAINVPLSADQPELQDCEFALFENNDSLYLYNIYSNIVARIKINAIEFMSYAKYTCLFIDKGTNTGILTCSKADLCLPNTSRKEVFKNSYFSLVFNLDNMLIYAIEPDNTDYSIDSNSYFYEIYGVNLVHTLTQDCITPNLVDKIFDTTKEVKFHEGVLFTVSSSDNYYDDFSEISFDDLDILEDDDTEEIVEEVNEVETLDEESEESEDWFSEDEEEEDEEDEDEDTVDISEAMADDCLIFAQKGALISKDYEVVFAEWSKRIPYVHTLEFMRRYLESENALSSDLEDCLIKIMCSLIESYNYQDMQNTSCYSAAEKHWNSVIEMFKSTEEIKKLSIIAKELIENKFATYINVLIYILWHINTSGSSFAINNIFADKLDFVAYSLIEKYFTGNKPLEDITKYLTVRHLEDSAKANNKKFKYPFKYNASLGVLDNVINANAAYRAVAEEYNSCRHAYISDVYNLIAAPNRLLRVKYFEKKKVRGRGWVDKPEFNLAYQYTYNFTQIGNNCGTEKPEKVAQKTWDAYTNLWTVMCPDYSVYLRNNFEHKHLRRGVYLLQTYHLHILSLLIPHDDLFLDSAITPEEEIKLLESIRLLCVTWQEFLSEVTFRSSVNRSIMDVISGVYTGIVKLPHLLPIYCEAYRKVYSTIKYFINKTNNYTYAFKQTAEILKNFIIAKPISSTYRITDKLKESSWRNRLQAFVDFDPDTKLVNRYIEALKRATTKIYSEKAVEPIFKLLTKYNMSEEKMIAAFEQHQLGETQCLRDLADLRSGALDFVFLAHGFAISNYMTMLYKPFCITTQQSNILAEAVTALKRHPEIYEDVIKLEDYVVSSITKFNAHTSFVESKEMADLHDLDCSLAYNMLKLADLVMQEPCTTSDFIRVLKNCIAIYLKDHNSWGITPYIPLWFITDHKQLAVFSVPHSDKFTKLDINTIEISFKTLDFSKNSALLSYPEHLDANIAYMSLKDFFDVLVDHSLDWLDNDNVQEPYDTAVKLFMNLDMFMSSIALVEKDKADLRNTIRNKYFV